MNIQAAIEHAIDGQSVLFVGAGFSMGATNIIGTPPPRGGQLAKILSQKVGLPEDLSLQEASESVIEDLGVDALIEELTKLYTVKEVASHHRTICQLPWKRIYTTNYDNVLELSHLKEGKNLQPITIGRSIYRTPKNQPICVHLNGYIKEINRDSLDDELKLTDTSYLTNSIANSAWADFFRQDIRLARSVFFLGYSLYDFDIKKILFDNAELKEKCFFILGQDVDSRTQRNAERFGTLAKISVESFSQEVLKVKQFYTPTDTGDLNLLSVREHLPTAKASPLPDQAFLNLMLYGKRNEEQIAQSLSSGKNFFLERSQTDVLFQLIQSGEQVIVVHSDLGNGKSLFIEGLRLRALEKGFRVFEAHEHSESTASELESIAKSPYKVLVTIEDYQNWRDEIRLFCMNASDNAVLVLTARSTIHDVMIAGLINDTGGSDIPEIRIDSLDSGEIDWFVESFNEYGLWGKHAGNSRNVKARYLSHNCNGEVHAILLKLLASDDISQRIRNEFEEIKRNKTHYEILISILIGTLANQGITMNMLVRLWGPDVIGGANFRRDSRMKQFIDVDKSEVLVRSPAISEFLLQNLVDASVITAVMTKMAIKSNESAHISRDYEEFRKNLVLFRNVQMVLPLENRVASVIRYYESIKNLSRCKEDYLFWLQYAIASLQIDELGRARKYFETAYSLAERRGKDTLQIDNHYARFLLVEAAQSLPIKQAMEQFQQARQIINIQIRQDNRHHPYRVASEYQTFFDRFESQLSETHLEEVRQACQSVLDQIPYLSDDTRRHRYVRKCKTALEYVVRQAEELGIRKAHANIKWNPHTK